MYPVTLTGRTVVLREFRADDAGAALRIFGDDAVTASLSFNSRSAEEVTAIIEAVTERAKTEPRTEYYLAVTLPGDQLIGFARLGFNGVQAAKLGYAIRADQWGHGYATDAAQALVSFGFNELGLHRISAAIGLDNGASIAVALQLGMQYEGRIRDHVHTNGAWRDSNLYAVLACDRKKQHQAPNKEFLHNPNM